MRSVMKYMVSATYKPLLVKYLSKQRIYSYKGITLHIPAGVFHPAFFFSTKLLFRHLLKEQLNGKLFLELGAGSGLLSIHAAKQGAVVTATDINPLAINCLKKNAEENKVAIEVIRSDMFQNIPKQSFDFIAINPPYYKKKPLSAAEYAWYCGENGEYFQSLFEHLHDYIHPHSNVWMVLSDGCDMDMIDGLARRAKFCLHCVATKDQLIEKNFIFKIQQL